jgi:hypothetical protein
MPHPPGHPLHGLLFHQDDIESLCAWRPIEWAEYAPMNEFHGIAALIKRYAGLPGDRPLSFALEHAVPYDLDAPYTYDLECGLPLFLAANEQSAALYRSAGMDARPVGFAALYGFELCRRQAPSLPEAARRGTLVFPDKSTLLMDTDFPREEFAGRLLALPEEFQPVTVCVYWKDVVRGTHRPFQEAGLPVVSCGHLQDPEFIPRFHDLCRRHRYACANDIAGSFTLSILAGCHFFHLPGGPLITLKHGVRTTHEADPGLSKPQKAACLAASPYPPQDPAPQRRLAAELAGTAHLKSPEALRALHREAVDAATRRATFGFHAFAADSSPQRRAAFATTGIDSCGWCRSASSLALPDSPTARWLRLDLWLPSEADERPQRLQIHAPGLRRRTRPLRAGRHRLHFLLPPGPVRLAVDAEVLYTLPDDPRSRSWRLAALRFHPLPCWTRPAWPSPSS